MRQFKGVKETFYYFMVALNSDFCLEAVCSGKDHICCLLMDLSGELKHF